MGVIYWQDSAEAFQIATSMQAIAVDAGLWEAYISFGTKGREIFQQCAKDSFDWSLDTVLAYAAFEDSPQPKASNPQPNKQQPAAAPSSGVHIRARGDDEDTKYESFFKWMNEVTAAVKQDSSLSYFRGGRRELKDGTVAVSVAVRRGAAFLRRVSFVFHYHPGAKGAQVGSTEGSKWHFKPFDGAKKWVRLVDHQFALLDQTMVKAVKETARNGK